MSSPTIVELWRAARHDPPMEIFESDYSHYAIHDDGIASATLRNPHHPRTPELMMQALDDLERFLRGTPRPLLCDPRTIVPLQPGAWRAIVDRLEKLAVALAIHVDDEREHGLGLFPAAIDSLLLPVRLFTEEVVARNWLVQFRDDS